MTKNNKTKFQYSKSVIFLPVILLFLFFTANTEQANFVQSTQKALQFALFASVLIGCLFIPNGFIKKPTPYLWKAIAGASFFYLSTLVYFLYLDKSSAIHIIKTYLDPSLSALNYQQVSYAEDCRIYTPQKQDKWGNVSHAFFDLFAFAHAMGWFFKTLICRDLKLIVFSSVAFQLIQYSLRGVLNNFKQCWWDHVVVDVFGCNLLGIVLGFYFIDKFNLQRYKWSLRDAPMKDSAWTNFKYFWLNWDLSTMETKAFSCLKKFLQMTWFVLFFQLNDLALFFLKYIYEVPADNYMVIFRTVLVGFLCFNAAKQYYRFTSEKQSQIRVNCFLANMIIMTEWFIVYKHGSNDFQHATINTLGIVYLSILAIVFALLFFKIMISDLLRFRKRLSTRTEFGISKRQILKDLSPFSGVTQFEHKDSKESVKSSIISQSQPCIKLKGF